MYISELILLDLKSTDGNPVVQGKLIFHLSTLARSSRPTDSLLALTSLPSNDCNCSVKKDSDYDESIYNESIYNESISDSSVYNTPVYTAPKLHSPSISLSRTLSSHTIYSGDTPIMDIPTTIIPGTCPEQQQPLHNMPARPSFGGTSTVDHPQNPARPSAPDTVLPGQPVTNAQHNLNANEGQYGDAPAQPAVQSHPPYLQKQDPQPRAHVQDHAPMHVTEKSNQTQRSLSTRSSISISVQPPVHASPPLNTATPLTTFSPLTGNTRKQTSYEHRRSLSGSILDGNKEERASTRKHRSLSVGSPSQDRSRERRKESISASGNHASASSSSSHGEQLHSRRVHTTDFSHLPTSPSTTSIQKFLRNTGSNSTFTPLSSKETQNHHTPNIAHSLLRGTQGGLSELDDQATVHFLRKLDGLSGKSVTRVRSSVGSLRLTSSSRPGTPSKSAQQREGASSDSGKTSRRSSMHIRDSTSLMKDKDQNQSASRQVAYLVDSIDISEQAASAFGGSDESQLSSPAQEKPPTKNSSASVRLSYTTKRDSASSTTYPITPTTSFRDSRPMSTGTSLASISAQSGRHSSKVRRNSVGSDISQSGDVTALKYRAALLVTASEQVEVGQDVPPVPPLPKGLSTYRSPPRSSPGASFPVEGMTEEESTQSDDVELNRSVPAEGVALPGPSVLKLFPTYTRLRLSYLSLSNSVCRKLSQSFLSLIWTLISASTMFLVFLTPQILLLVHLGYLSTYITNAPQYNSCILKDTQTCQL